MTATLLRPLGFGEILDGAFSLYRRHFAAFFATSLIAMAPMSLVTGIWTRWMLGLELDAAPESTGWLFWLLPLFLLAMIAVVVGFAGLTRQVGRAVEGGEVTVADGLGAGVGRFFPVAAAGIAAYAALFLILMALSGAVGVVAGLAVAFAGPVAAIALSVGATVGAAVLMLAILASLFAIVPSVVIEGTGPLASLGRSWRLARGARLRILGILLVSWLIIMLPWTGVMMAAGMGAAVYDANATAALSTTQFLFQQVLGVLSGSLTFPFWVACVTLLYYDRRVRTEAYDLEATAAKLAFAS